MNRNQYRKLAANALLCLVFAAGSATAGTKSDTLNVLDGIQPTWADTQLKVWLNDGSGKDLRIGDEFIFHFASSNDCYLSIFHVDSHGVATILLPKSGAQGNKLLAGQQRSYPASNDAFSLQAEPPLGLENFLVACTERPLNSQLLIGNADAAVFEAVDAANKARQFSASIAENNKVTLARLSSRVVGRSDDSEYTSDDIVNFFTTRTRSIQRPKLDLHIQFDYDSADLTEDSKQMLKSFAEALNATELASMSFEVGGHTDSTGPDVYNEDLSLKRANAVRQYLAAELSIDENRLSSVGHGESAPLEDNGSDTGRAMNRRVEFEMTAQ